MASEGCAERHTDGGDFVFGLHRADPEMLVPGQLVENVASRRDGVRTESYWQLGELSRCDNAPGQSGVTRNAGVLAGWEPRRTNLVAVADSFGRFAKVESGLEGGLVSCGDLFVLREFLVDPLDCWLCWAGEHERHESESEEVLRTLSITRFYPKRSAHLFGEVGHRHPE